MLWCKSFWGRIWFRSVSAASCLISSVALVRGRCTWPRCSRRRAAPLLCDVARDINTSALFSQCSFSPAPPSSQHLLVTKQLSVPAGGCARLSGAAAALPARFLQGCSVSTGSSQMLNSAANLVSDGTGFATWSRS